MPQGLGLGASWLTAPVTPSACWLPPWLTAHFFCGSASVLVPMSRGDHLRQLVAQLTMLAALEDSIALGISRVMGTAGSAGSSASAAAGLSAASAAVAAPVAPASSHARSRSRSPAPLPKRAPRRSSSTAPGARGSVALADLGLVTGLAVKSCPPVPPAQLRFSRAVPPQHPGAAPEASARSAPASVASRASVAASDSDADWDALLDAHGLAPPPDNAGAADAQPANAAGASRRVRDQRRRRLRKAAKRSMWREI